MVYFFSWYFVFNHQNGINNNEKLQKPKNNMKKIITIMFMRIEHIFFFELLNSKEKKKIKLDVNIESSIDLSFERIFLKM